MTKSIMKTILKMGLIGAAIGVTIMLIIPIIISLSMSYSTGGRFYFTTPSFTQLVGNEAVAALLYVIAGIVYGFIIGTFSYVWKIERWSLTKQTTIHYFGITVTVMPIALACQWIPLQILPIVIYIAIFTTIYSIIWGANYLIIKHNIKKLNSKLKDHS